MAFKFVISFALLAVASAGIVDVGYNSNYYHQPQAYVQPAIVKKVVHEEAPANYDFNYEVHDTHTGDIKRQHEKAENGAISGQYSLVDADGYRRVVSYTADDHHGFQANVQREPLDHKVIAQPQQVLTKVIQPATVTKVIQPATISKVYQPAAYSHGLNYQQPAAFSHGLNYQQPAAFSHGYHQAAPVYESHGHHYNY